MPKLITGISPFDINVATQSLDINEQAQMILGFLLRDVYVPKRRIQEAYNAIENVLIMARRKTPVTVTVADAMMTEKGVELIVETTT